MSWSVEVIHHGDLPPMTEKVSSFASCPGNIVTSLVEIGLPRLHEIEGNEAKAAALAKMLWELRLGNNGKYSDAYCVKCDKQWSGGVETRKEYEKYIPLMEDRPKLFPFWDYETFVGDHTRRHLTKYAELFYLYFKAGYEVTFTW